MFKSGGRVRAQCHPIGMSFLATLHPQPYRFHIKQHLQLYADWKTDTPLPRRRRTSCNRRRRTQFEALLSLDLLQGVDKDSSETYIDLQSNGM